MKITILLLVTIWCLKLKPTMGNYRRVIRGPQPPRPPPQMHHPMKKWTMNQHRPMVQRPRPIPLHVPQNFKNKQPMGPPIQPGRHPIRTNWPNQISPVKVLTTEKPFLSSPVINLPEYEFHLQTNSIPNNHPNTIKQLDEKGPIHTIPAPNLSLADKPKNVEEVKAFPQAQAYTAPLQFNFEQQAQQSKHHNEKVHVQKTHQYQVTESTVPIQQQIFFNQQQQQPHAEFLVSPQEPTSTQMTTQELYKLLNTFPPQQSLDAYVPVQYVTNFPRNSLQANQNLKKLPIQPQFQIFDFDEQRNNQMTKVTADYSVKPAYEDGEALAQAQFVQQFFDTRNEHIATNKVEPELKESLDAYFPAIPNKAAESLLNLQEAGKVNAKEKTESANSVPISIYVPDNERFDENVEENRKNKPEDNVKFEESDGDEVEQFQRHPTFGKRKKTRS